MRDLTLIDDPRVVPWYVKAMQTDSYDLKFNALDRLARMEGDEALTGLKIGMATQGKDIGNCTTAKVAAESAENIRHSAAIALARSPHPQANTLLWSMENDPARAVRLTVIQTAAEMATTQSLELIRRHTADVDASVRAEAVRLLKVREGARGEPRG
jgi:HEAT repeat protein